MNTEELQSETCLHDYQATLKEDFLWQVYQLFPGHSVERSHRVIIAMILLTQRESL